MIIDLTNSLLGPERSPAPAMLTNGWTRALAFASACLLLCSPAASAQYFQRTYPSPCYVPACYPTQFCVTEYRNGDYDGALQVHFAGSKHEEIQAFFAHQYFSESLTRHAHLHCTATVSFPQAASDYSTFALSYSEHGWPTQFALYGISQADQSQPGQTNRRICKLTNDPSEVHKTQIPQTYQVATDPHHPVQVEWISSQVAKVRHGPGLSKSIILRFIPENGGSWIALDKTPITPPK